MVELNPVCNHTADMLQDFEAVTVYALLLERSNHALDHAVLLRAMRRNELLVQSVTAHQRLTYSPRLVR